MSIIKKMLCKHKYKLLSSHKDCLILKCLDCEIVKKVSYKKFDKLAKQNKIIKVR